jgi:hypothetical protein
MKLVHLGVVLLAVPFIGTAADAKDADAVPAAVERGPSASAGRADRATDAGAAATQPGARSHRADAADARGRWGDRHGAVAFAGGAINAADSRGWTALMYAAWSGRSKVVKLLLEKRARRCGRIHQPRRPARRWDGHLRPRRSRSAPEPTQRARQRRRVASASAQGHLGVIRLLIGKGADQKRQQRRNPGAHGGGGEQQRPTPSRCCWRRARDQCANHNGTTSADGRRDQRSRAGNGSPARWEPTRTSDHDGTRRSASPRTGTPTSSGWRKGGAGLRTMREEERRALLPLRDRAVYFRVTE